MSLYGLCVKHDAVYVYMMRVCSPAQCQYAYLHQCVRDVLRARKLRNEQENPLYPIYENVNPDPQRGKLLLMVPSSNH